MRPKSTTCRHCKRPATDDEPLVKGTHEACRKRWHRDYIKKYREEAGGSIHEKRNRRIVPMDAITPRVNGAFHAYINGRQHRCGPFVCTRVEEFIVYGDDASGDAWHFERSTWRFELLKPNG